MSVSEMTSMSYLLIALSVLSGMAAVIMFFAFNVGKSWKILCGKPIKSRNYSMHKIKKINRKPIKQLKPVESTVLLESTEIFKSAEPTALIESNRFEHGMSKLQPDRDNLYDEDVSIIQDIVYIAK